MGETFDLGKYGPWALVLGGSDGVGEVFCRRLAEQGCKLIIAARRPEPLNLLANDLRAQGAEVRTVSVDLSKADALEHVRAVTDDLEVGLLIYNAGAVGGQFEFLAQDPEKFLGLIMLNVSNQAAFSHHFGGLMKARGRGGIILLGSNGSFMGAYGVAVYMGAKGFSRIFAEGLWIELEEHGVDVLHLSIGLTDTPNVRRRMTGSELVRAQSPEDAAQEGLDHLGKGPLWIAGGESNLKIAIERSRLSGRADAIRALREEQHGSSKP